MTQQDSIGSAIELAKVRWAAVHAFDLEDALWAELFATHNTGDVLQAVRLSAQAHSSNPATRYRIFEQKLARLHEQRELSQIFQ